MNRFGQINRRRCPIRNPLSCIECSSPINHTSNYPDGVQGVDWQPVVNGSFGCHVCPINVSKAPQPNIHYYWRDMTMGNPLFCRHDIAAGLFTPVECSRFPLWHVNARTNEKQNWIWMNYDRIDAPPAPYPVAIIQITNSFAVGSMARGCQLLESFRLWRLHRKVSLNS